MRKKGALGGGTFTDFNKTFPGTYTNMVSIPRAQSVGGDRGLVTAGIELDWGKEGIIRLSSSELQTEALEVLGYSFVDEKLSKVRDLANGAKEVLLYRLNSGGKQATATVGGLTATAKYTGIRGNDIKVVVRKDVDNEELFEVQTYVKDDLKDTQTVTKASDLVDNDFVDFSGDALEETAGTNLEGGENGKVTGESYAKYLDEIEAENFDVIAYDGEDEATKALIHAFVVRMNEEEGYKVTGVLQNYSKANYKDIISIFNEGAEEGESAVFWYAGHTAGADYNQSLMNRLYTGEAKIKTNYKKREMQKANDEGNVVLYADGDDIRILKDVNTFTEYTLDQGEEYSDNRVVRTLNHAAMTTALIFNRVYLGKADNNEITRTIFKTQIAREREKMETKGAIEDFSIDDLEVMQGPKLGDVILNEVIKVTGAMEVLYQTIKVI